MIYRIIGRLNNGSWEDIDEFDSENEAEKMLTEYKLAYGKGWTLKIVKGAK